MPNFVCKNKKCINFEQKGYYPTVRFKWNNETLRLEADEDICPICGERREVLKDYEGFSSAWFKAETDRNYDNKKVKTFEYNRDLTKPQTVELPKKRV